MDIDPGSSYLGGSLDAAGERGGPFLFDADDLVTHGVIVGMTGSGKTGLGSSRWRKATCGSPSFAWCGCRPAEGPDVARPADPLGWAGLLLA